MKQLPMFGKGKGALLQRRLPREGNLEYAAVEILRERGCTVWRAGLDRHKVDGRQLSTRELLKLAAGYVRYPVREETHDREWLASMRREHWKAQRVAWLARAPLPRGHRLTDKVPS